jgi:hypothetical protein
MKAQILASIMLVGASSAALAEGLAPESQPAPVTGAAATESDSGETAVQFKTFGAGNQMLIDISAQVGNDLDAKLEQDVGGEVTVKVRSHELLVSKN